MLPRCHPMGGQHQVPAAGPRILCGDMEPFEAQWGVAAPVLPQPCQKTCRWMLKTFKF